MKTASCKRDSLSLDFSNLQVDAQASDRVPAVYDYNYYAEVS